MKNVRRKFSKKIKEMFRIFWEMWYNSEQNIRKSGKLFREKSQLILCNFWGNFAKILSKSQECIWKFWFNDGKTRETHLLINLLSHVLAWKIVGELEHVVFFCGYDDFFKIWKFNTGGVYDLQLVHVRRAADTQKLIVWNLTSNKCQTWHGSMECKKPLQNCFYDRCKRRITYVHGEPSNFISAFFTGLTFDIWHLNQIH